MSVGYQVLNDAGGILLDANYPNLALIAKGTVNIGTNTYAGGWYGQLNVPDTGPSMVFIRSPGFAAVLGVDAGVIQYYLGKGSTSFDYWVFGPPQDVGARFGMQVFTDDSRLAFDAAQRYLRVIGSINTNTGLIFPDQGGVGPVQSFALPGGTPAVCFVDPGFQYQVLTGDGVWGGFTFRTVAQCAMRISGQSLDIALVQNVGSLDLPGNVRVNTRGGGAPISVILADVSGF